MTAAPLRIRLAPTGDIIDFLDDYEDVDAQLARIGAGLTALGLELVRTVGTPLEELSLFTRGTLEVAFYWDGFFTSLLFQTGDRADFAALFTEMAGSSTFVGA